MQENQENTGQSAAGANVPVNESKPAGEAMEMHNNEAVQQSPEVDGFLQKHGPTLFLIGFGAYLVLLSIGVVAEIFDIQSILDWWIWRPPGKPAP